MKQLVGLSWLVMAGVMEASLEVPSFFSEGMVLQQGGGAAVWGTSGAGKDVTLTFAGKEYQTKAATDGKWTIKLDELAASSEGKELTITSDGDNLFISDVVVGEVWIASGQSNMEWALSRLPNYQDEVETAQDDLLRVYVSQNAATATPQTDFPGHWKSTQPENTASFTAVGYFFAKRLREELDVPVGVIECAWGGKPVQAFASEEALEKLPEAKKLLAAKARAVAAWDDDKEEERYQALVEKFKKEGRKGRPVRRPHPSVSPRNAGTIFNGMIAPITGYGARGVIWYQGESNSKPGEAEHYEELLGSLVADWRSRWGSDLSFYWVQLANFIRKGESEEWVTVQDEMRRALDSIPNSGMAVINDIGNAKNIHPKNKVDVGERLARWALEKNYGVEVGAVCGPLFDKAAKEGKRMVVSFKHSEGLKSRDGNALQRFEIADKKGAWKAAKAKIDDGKVVVWHDEVEEPTGVRYAWTDNPTGANLVNGDGLPASCFTTE
ncbi:MAG: sialate O-acetylesterase [Verrucomicrobiota bacterium JB023]|nr:sialate O-acetylesterase [Verrucomicrobiota bacterium JB023]